jgi:hypothetical protein
MDIRKRVIYSHGIMYHGHNQALNHLQSQGSSCSLCILLCIQLLYI